MSGFSSGAALMDAADRARADQREADAALVEAAANSVAITIDRYVAAGHGENPGLLAQAIVADLVAKIREGK